MIKFVIFRIYCVMVIKQQQVQLLQINLVQQHIMDKQIKIQNNPSKSILYSNNHLTYIQLAELQKTISELVQQNRKKHAKIIIQRPEFSYQLYKISEFQAISKAFGKELLLRQLDRLLEEKNYLDRELSLIVFEDEEKTNEKEKMVANQTNHFQLLKSIWKKDNSKKHQGTLQHIEELNLMVGQIKSNIQSLIKFQSNDSKQFQQTYINTFQVLHQKNRQCQKCHQYQAKAEYLTTKIQGLQEKLSKQSDENIAYLQQINNKDDKLKRINKTYIKQEVDLKNKIILLQQEILKKDQNIRQLKKQIVELSSPYKFVNNLEKYELIVKGTQVDLSKYNKEISVSLQSLVKLITNPNPNDISSAASFNAFITKQNSIKLALQDSITQIPTITFKNPSSLERIRKDSYENTRSDKMKGFLGEQLNLKIQQIEGNKKYMRTSSKRVHRGSTSSQNEQGNGSATNMKITSINVI